MTSNISWENYTQWKGITGLTTEVLRPETLGSETSRQRFSCSSHAEMRVMTVSGSVAVFTSDRPFAQAHEDTSHMKENTAVTTKSWRSRRKNASSFFTTDSNTSKPLKCEEQTNSQSERPCCFHGTSPVWNSTRRGLPWSRGRKTQQWWRRTRLRRSSPRLGINVRGSLPYRWEHQSKPDGAWEEQHKEAETLEGEASDNTALTSMISAILPLSPKCLEL